MSRVCRVGGRLHSPERNMMLAEWITQLNENKSILNNRLFIIQDSEETHLAWSIETISARLAVNSSCVVRATETDSASFVFAVNVQTQFHVSDSLVIVTLVRFIVTVTLCGEKYTRKMIIALKPETVKRSTFFRRVLLGSCLGSVRFGATRRLWFFVVVFSSGFRLLLVCRFFSLVLVWFWRGYFLLCWSLAEMISVLFRGFRFRFFGWF